MTDNIDNLTFQELRDICYRHMHELCMMYSNGRFTDPEPYWLKEEFANIIGRLRGNGAKYEFQDLVNAFYSSIFELEYGQKLYPNALVVLGANHLCRVTSFENCYPVKINFRVYRKHCNGKLRIASYSRILKERIYIVLKKDPLAA